MYNNLPLQDLLALTVRESSADLLLKFPTIKDLAEATEEVLDHVIIGSQKYVSLKERGVI